MKHLTWLQFTLFFPGVWEEAFPKDKPLHCLAQRLACSALSTGHEGNGNLEISPVTTKLFDVEQQPQLRTNTCSSQHQAAVPDHPKWSSVLL